MHSSEIQPKYRTICLGKEKKLYRDKILCPDNGDIVYRHHINREKAQFYSLKTIACHKAQERRAIRLKIDCHIEEQLKVSEVSKTNNKPVIILNISNCLINI